LVFADFFFFRDFFFFSFFGSSLSGTRGCSLFFFRRSCFCCLLSNWHDYDEQTCPLLLFVGLFYFFSSSAPWFFSAFDFPDIRFFFVLSFL